MNKDNQTTFNIAESEFEYDDICRHEGDTDGDYLVRITDILYSKVMDEWNYQYEYLNKCDNGYSTIEEFEARYNRLLIPECPGCDTRGDYYGSEVICPKNSCGVEKYNGEFELATTGEVR